MSTIQPRNTSFDKISDSYDELWFFSNEYQEWMLRSIVELLNLKPNSVLADLGGGTGVVTSKIVLNSEIDKATCVEPSVEMLNKARVYPELICENRTAEDFVANCTGFSYILIKEVIHHIKDRKSFWLNLKQGNPSSEVLIVTRPPKPGFILFEDVYREFSRSQPSVDNLTAELEVSGFTCKSETRAWSVQISKTRWFNMLRSRFISELFKFSDEEIENGICQIDSSVVCQDIRFEDEIVFIKAT